MKQFLVYISLFLILNACQQNIDAKDSRTGEHLLAEVQQNKFYLSDISKFHFKNLPSEDSTALLKNLVDEWVNAEIFSLTAKEKISDLNEILVEAANYKRELITASYEKQLISNFELELTEQELEEYYNQHLEFFVFKEAYYDINYILLPKTTKNLAKIKKAITEKTENHWLDNYCIQEPGKCVIDKSSIEKETFLTENFKLKGTKLNISKKYNYQYISNVFVMIYRINKAYKIGDTAPLEIVKTEVTKLAMYKKKQEYLKEIKEKTIQKAKNDKIFETHIN